MFRATFVLLLACGAASCLACSTPEPTTLASGLEAPWGLAVRGGEVYFSAGGAIKRVSTRGGPITVLASGQPAPHELATDGTNVYWVNAVEEVGSVMKVPIDGGTPTALATNQNNPTGIATDGASVYYISHGAVMKVPVGGGAAVAVASNVFAGPFSIDETAVYFTSVSATNDLNWQLLALPLEGGATTTLATGPTASYAPIAIAIDATNVYWEAGQVAPDYGGNVERFVIKVPKTGGTPTKLAELSPDYHPYPYQASTGFAVDPTSVYFVDLGGFFKVPVGGGAVVPFAINVPTDAMSFALDDEYVYWTSGIGVLKTPKSP